MKMFIINIVPTSIMYNILFYMKTTIKTIYYIYLQQYILLL